jgi:hypothetical protein
MAVEAEFVVKLAGEHVDTLCKLSVLLGLTPKLTVEKLLEDRLAELERERSRVQRCSTEDFVTEDDIKF